MVSAPTGTSSIKSNKLSKTLAVRWPGLQAATARFESTGLPEGEAACTGGEDCVDDEAVEPHSRVLGEDGHAGRLQRCWERAIANEPTLFTHWTWVIDCGFSFAGR